jgi:hypothetical protein
MAFEARRAYKRALLRNLFLDFLIMLFAFLKLEFVNSMTRLLKNVFH